MSSVHSSQANKRWQAASELECLAATSLLYAYALLHVEPSRRTEQDSSFPRERFLQSLNTMNVAPLSAAEVVDRAEDAWMAVRKSAASVVPVRVGDYDSARARITKAADRKPRPGSLSWPVSANSIRQALGGEAGKWSTALKSLGLVAGARGRAEGGSFWTDEQLRQAWDEYGDHARLRAEAPTVVGYEQWKEQSDASAPPMTTLINRLGANSWRELRALIATAPEPLPSSDESIAVRAQRGFVGVQEDYLAGLEARNIDLNEDAEDGVDGAADALRSNVDLIGWARLSVATQRTTLDIEQARNDQAERESETRRKNDNWLAIGVVIGSFLSTAAGVVLTKILHVY